MADPTHRKRLVKATEAIASMTDPFDRLDAARAGREQFERLELDQVRTLREQGTTWSRIGALYGLTKQGAQQRFRSRLKD